MWKQMLLTEQLEILMDESNLQLEVRLIITEKEKANVVRLTHAELMQLMHTLLEINRSFRGDIAYFHSVQVSDRALARSPR